MWTQRAATPALALPHPSPLLATASSRPEGEGIRARQIPSVRLRSNFLSRAIAMMKRSALVCLLLFLAISVAADSGGAEKKEKKESKGKAFDIAAASTPAEQIHVPEGFKVEL